MAYLFFFNLIAYSSDTAGKGIFHLLETANTSERHYVTYLYMESCVLRYYYHEIYFMWFLLRCLPGYRHRIERFTNAVHVGVVIVQS